jgi:hypothetical protein
MNEEYKKYKFLVEKHEGRDNLGKQGGTGRMILKWMIRAHSLPMFTGVMWLRTVYWRAFVNSVMDFQHA